MAKYNNHKVSNSFGSFDSRKEFQRYAFLLSKQSEGAIHGLRRQVKFVLIPTQYRTETVQLKTKSKTRQVVAERECAYFADFVYFRGAEQIVEDIKGVGGGFSTATKDFVIKRKLMLYKYDISVRVVSKATDWQ
ncbi:MAG: DUF1064 domain-containing protein [Bacteroidales bacterium]|nr:DUF1064 domain-containing protein [Candidatus Colicola equi]